MSKKQIRHPIFCNQKLWDKITELAHFYGTHTNTKLITLLILSAYELMQKNNRTVMSLNSSELNLIKPIENLNNLTESLFINVSLLTTWLTKTNKSFKNLTLDDIKKYKHDVLKIIKENDDKK
ncbi:MAG: hypothetical protein LBP70_00185 [Mycoplasmataceae bacterium]|jgi:hypothetical protein|nr:hypothetical protein [Mycoplasmataceae bacterium]